MKLGALRTPRPRAIPLGDALQLRPQAVRTVAVRAVLALLATAALVGAIVVSRDAQGDRTNLFGSRRSGVVVIDASASIGGPARTRIGRAFRRLGEARSSFGLVFFSDVAYEAVPPGTPATELRSLVRFFAPSPREEFRRFRRRFLNRPAPRRETNPWTSLRGGTRISTGLGVARQMLKREGDLAAGVLLISDLDNSAFDGAALTRMLDLYKRERIPMRVLGLNPSPEDTAFFEGVLGRESMVSSAELAPRPAGDRANDVESSSEFPFVLVGIGLALLLALAANEHWSARLRWRGGRA